MLYGHGDDAFKYEDIQMNFSSNIYGHADMTELKRYLAKRLDAIDAYPEPEPKSLEKMIADRSGIPSPCVMVTNGATDAIYIIAQALKARGYLRVSILNPTFREYEDACRMYDLETDECQIDTCHGSVVWLCNPNNPTGATFGNDFVIELAKRNRMLIIDQSYETYTNRELLSEKDATDSGNIIQIHSFTKTYAIPGLRIGYVTANSGNIGMLRAFARPWAVNALAIEAAKWLLCHDVRAVNDINAYLRETQRLHDMLSQIEGIEVMPTKTNFLLARIHDMTAATLKQLLAEKHHMLIREASNFRNLDEHYFRVAAQSKEENDALVSAIRKCMDSSLLVNQENGKQT